MTSKSLARRKTSSTSTRAWIIQFGLPLSGASTTGTSSAVVRESPVAKSVTRCPCRTSSSVRYDTTRSVPPYRRGGTFSNSGATCAIRTRSSSRFQGLLQGSDRGGNRLVPEDRWGPLGERIRSGFPDAGEDPQHLGHAPGLSWRCDGPEGRFRLEAL